MADRGEKRCSSKEGPMITGTRGKSHICKECSEEFTTSSRLRKHRKTHTGEKPHVCPDCDEAFSTKQHIKRPTQERNPMCVQTVVKDSVS